MIHKAWGLTNSSPSDLKLYFDKLQLNYSHLFKTPKGAYQRTAYTNRKEQKLFPVIVEGIGVMHKISSMEKNVDLIVFCFASKAEIFNSNLTPLHISEGQSQRTVEYALRALDDKPYFFKYREPSLLEIVATVNKPSVHNSLLTLYGKIANAKLKETISTSVMQYLNGNLIYSKLDSILRSTLLGDAIREVLNTEEAHALKQAVQEVKRGRSVQDVADQYNIECFDINYIMKRK